MTTVLLTGILVAFLATTLAAAFQRAPTRLTCPECGKDTQPVQAPAWIKERVPSFVLRWCPACSWEGMGRVGADWVPGRPVAHDSGFHWGNERLPEDFGFRFAAPPEMPAGQEPPHHPSGFRFASTEEEPGAAHPSGFNWGERVGRPPFRSAPPAAGGGQADAPPAGFRWKEAAEDAGFRWGEGSGPGKRPPGFRWKDVG